LAEIKSRMLLPRPPSEGGEIEEDPRAELVRRLQQYERFKKAAEDLDHLPRLERDVFVAEAELTERKVLKQLPDVTLKEMLLAFKDVIQRAAMFAHHQVQRERLSVRARMTHILERVQTDEFVDFMQLFKPAEGRVGVTVTFVAILELLREGLIEIVQNEIFAPLHVRRTSVVEPMAVARLADQNAQPQASSDEESAALSVRASSPSADTAAADVASSEGDQ